MIYNKLYTKRLDFPKVIPAKGLNSMETDYYILLEKNYFPVTSTISKKVIQQSGSENWITTSNINLTVEDNYYNKLSIQGIGENNTEIKNTALIEFTAEISDKSKMIEPCNTLLLYIEQAENEEISAHIVFETIYNGQFINNGDLTINGDTQNVKFYYYGYNNGHKIMSPSNLIIKLNGEDLIKENIISKLVTTNGIEVIYKIDEFVQADSQRNFLLTCTYNTEYNTAEITKNIHQISNFYEIEIINVKDYISGSNLNKQGNNYEIIANTQEICIEYKVKKNNTYITNNVTVTMQDILDTPSIQYNEIYTKYDTDNNCFKKILDLNPNFTPYDFVLTITVNYQNYGSDTINLIQKGIENYVNNQNLVLWVVDRQNLNNDNLIGRNDITISAIKKQLTYDYYATYNNIPFTNASYVKNGIKYNNYIDIINSTFNIVSNELSETYRTIVLDIPENKTSEEIYGSFTVKLLSKTGTVNIKQDISSIEIIINEYETKSIIGGLDDSRNDIIVTFKCLINNEFKQEYLNDITVTITSLQDSTYEYIKKDNLTITYNEPYIIVKIPHNGSYGLDALANNVKPIITYNITINFKGQEKIVSVSKHPVYFDAVLECRDLIHSDNTPYDYEINGLGETVNLYFYGIIYNYNGDNRDNFIYCLEYASSTDDSAENNALLKITTEDTNFITFQTNPDYVFTPSYLKRTAIFEPNINNEKRLLNIKLTFKGIEKILTFSESILSVHLLFHVTKVGFLSKNKEIMTPVTSTVNKLYINPLYITVLECCAEFVDDKNNPLPMDNSKFSIISEDTFIHTLDASNGKFNIVKNRSNKINNKEYLTYYIQPHYNPLLIPVDDENYDVFKNLPNTTINYKLIYNFDVDNNGEISINTGDISNNITKTILIKKKKLDGNLFLSFNNSKESEPVYEKQVTNNPLYINFYCIYSYYNEEDNVMYYDSNANNYSIDISSGSTINLISNYIQQNEGGTNIIDNNPHFGAGRQNANRIVPTQINQNITSSYDEQNNVIIFSIKIPQNSEENTKELGFKIKYKNESLTEQLTNSYYKVLCQSEKMTIKQMQSFQELTFRLSDFITFESSSDSSYYMSGNKTEFKIYVKTLLNGEIVLNQATRITPNLTATIVTSETTVLNCILTYETYNVLLQEYVYKVTCSPVASKTAKLITITLKWIYNEKTNTKTFKVNQRGAETLQAIINTRQSIPAEGGTLNIQYYMLSDNIIFDPSIYNNTTFTLTGQFQRQQSSETETVTFGTITKDSNFNYNTTYVFDQNTGLKTNKLSLNLAYTRAGYNNDNCFSNLDITQLVANMEYCLELSTYEITDGSGCTLIIDLFYKLNG